MQHQTFEAADLVIPTKKDTAKVTKGPVKRLFARMMKHHARRNHQDLTALSDRSLQDVGVSRSELGFTGIRPTEFDAIRFLSRVHTPDAR